MFERHRPQGTRGDELAREARCHRFRYLAAITYDTQRSKLGLALMARSCLATPLVFLRTRRSYLVTAALLAQAFLPDKVHATLERLARAVGA